ncbi:MAG: hypothetical protein KTR14_04265 [Vampirovibrio sp.]|nr:hypothetical protein [Vampirovibrio sp.]
MRLVFTGAYLLLLCCFLYEALLPRPDLVEFVDTFNLDFGVKLMYTLTDLLMLPVETLLQILQPYLSPEIKDWFPEMASARVLESIIQPLVNLPLVAGSDLAKYFEKTDIIALAPGVMNWTYLLAIVFWVIIECCWFIFEWGMVQSLNKFRRNQDFAQKKKRAQDYYEGKDSASQHVGPPDT